MKPVRKTAARVIEYWECSVSTHRHTTQEIAANCIAKRAAAKKNHGRWSNEDLEAVARMHEEGMTYRAIGERIGKSGSHARNLHVKALRNRRRDHADPFQSLGVRARNCLFSRGLNTIEAVRAAHESGFLKKIPNMGKASIDEVAAMLDAVRPNA